MFIHLFTTLFILFSIITSASAQISINSCGLDVNTPAGSIAFSVGEIANNSNNTAYFINEGIQFGYTIHPNKYSTSLNVNIYPNPTTDLVYFKVQNAYYNNLAYRIYNDLGKELMNGKIHNANTSASLHQLPASTYFIKVYSNIEEIVTFKIIKIY